MLEYYEEKQLQEKNSGTSPEHRIAVVKGVSGSKMQLLFDGEPTASDKYYRGLATVSVGSRVLCARVSGTYVVLGEILE